VIKLALVTERGSGELLEVFGLQVVSVWNGKIVGRWLTSGRTTV
jgi:hypothetical protein